MELIAEGVALAGAEVPQPRRRGGSAWWPGRASAASASLASVTGCTGTDPRTAVLFDLAAQKAGVAGPGVAFVTAD